MKRSANFGVKAFLMIFFCVIINKTNAQQITNANKSLNEKEKSLITISSLTATGGLVNLKEGLSEALVAGLTINEIKEVIVQLYAYCGFPRSINALQIFMSVLKDRKAKGINDIEGKEATLISSKKNKYIRGKNILMKLSKMPQPDTLSGYGAFAPVIDTFLKQHLFADIFERDILTFKQREFVTIAALAALHGVEPQLQAHINVGKNTGITDSGFKELADIIEKNISRTQANTVRKIIGQPMLTVTDNDMMVRISEIEIVEEFLTEYNTILQTEAAASVKLEAGVIAIFPMYQKENTNQIRIVEIYKNTDAYKDHLKTSHFLHYKSATLKMVKTLRLIDMQSLDQQTMLEIFRKIK